MDTIWKTIIGFEHYSASSRGEIKNNLTGKIISQSKGTKYVYRFVYLYKEGSRHYKSVSRLVYEAFYGPIPEGFEVNHINEDRNDNSLENLNLMTHKDNINYGTRNERMIETRLANHNKKGPNKKGPNEKKILQLDFNGNIIGEFASARDAERKTGCANSHIVECCKGKRKTAYGFLWQYTV